MKAENYYEDAKYVTVRVREIQIVKRQLTIDPTGVIKDFVIQVFIRQKSRKYTY